MPEEVAELRRHSDAGTRARSETQWRAWSGHMFISSMMNYHTLDVVVVVVFSPGGKAVRAGLISHSSTIVEGLRVPLELDGES